MLHVRPAFLFGEITEDVRKFAAEQGISENQALEKGLKEKAQEFRKLGSEVYAKA
jgi:phosphomethylpyrimidine synthase